VLIHSIHFFSIIAAVFLARDLPTFRRKVLLRLNAFFRPKDDVLIQHCLAPHLTLREYLRLGL